MKKLMKENKPIFFMIVIVIVCAIISVALLFKYFYFGNGGTKYGDRLDGIDKVAITDSKRLDVEAKAKESKGVSNAEVLVTGKIIYIRISFDTTASLVDAQSTAVKLLEEFSDEEKNFYDIQFTLVQDATDNSAGFKIMGAKNVNGSNLVWNNNNISEKE